MSLFHDAEVNCAYLKAGVAGFASSGKTKTSGIIARGLVRLARDLSLPYATKPVYMLDTETGSSYIKKDFDAEGIKLRVLQTRAFSDLIPATKEAVSEGSVLIIDQATHFWREFCKTYQQERAKKYKVQLYKMQPLDWAFVKNAWSEFTDLYVNSPLHIILGGRGGYEFDMVEDEDGKKELQKTDVKMAGEKEMAFEPSLLLWMERHRDMNTMQAYRTANVLKDRFDVIDGKEFRNPTFENFMPHIQLLNLAGHQVGFEQRTSASLIPTADMPRNKVHIQREIVIDEIQTLLTMHYPSQSAEDKKNKLKAILKHFDATWTEIEKIMSLFDLRAGYESMHQELEGKPSRYAAAIERDKPVAMNDELPAHSAPPIVRGTFTTIEVPAEGNNFPGMYGGLVNEVPAVPADLFVAQR
jgi:hypothetical protein